MITAVASRIWANVASLTHRSARDIPTLDGVRALAVLWVCVFHIFLGFGERKQDGGPADLPALLDARPVMAGDMGVDLFFILSGFLIAEMIMSAKLAAFNAWTFLYRRFLRIAPAYALAIALSMAGAGGAEQGVACRRYWYTHILFINNLPGVIDPHTHDCLSQTWSIAVEFQVCDWFPFCVSAVHGNRNMRHFERQ
jgi:peptidoglycan/LPS O-acetylase OafA/YrhL